MDVVVGSVGGVRFEGGEVVCEFSFVELESEKCSFDVFEENVLEDGA